MRYKLKNKLKSLKLKIIDFKNNIVSKCIKHPKISNPKLIMTILAKNEEDIIEENLKFHKAMGVDSFIVTDNNSTDGTRAVFEKYKKLGWIEEIIDEKGDNHSQSVWVDRMIRLATDKYGADWIINADADEFWYSKKGNIKEYLKESNKNKVICEIYNMLPNESGKFYNSINMVSKCIDNNEEYGLSKFNMYTKQIPKVMHRAKGYKKVHEGNHNVDMKYSSQEVSKDIIILHYSIRSLKHFKNKMINGGKAYEKNLKLDKNVGAHWRYYYNGWKDNTLNLDTEYKKSIGYDHIDLFKNIGIIKEIKVIQEILNNNN